MSAPLGADDLDRFCGISRSMAKLFLGVATVHVSNCTAHTDYSRECLSSDQSTGPVTSRDLNSAL